MNNIYKISLLFICTIFSLQVILASDQLLLPQATPLSTELTTDLVICNDIYEINSPSSTKQAMQVNLSQALKNEKITLCSKGLWVSLQQFNKFETSVNSYITDVMDFNNNNLDENIKNKGLTLLQKYISDIQNTRTNEEINKLIANFSSDFIMDVNNPTDWTDVVKSIANKYLTHKEFNNLTEKYDCKDTGEHLLFIPKKLQQKDKPLNEQNRLMGLSYAELPDYNHNAKLSEEQLTQLKFEYSNLRANGKLAGEDLLKTLNRLQVKNVQKNHYHF